MFIILFDIYSIDMLMYILLFYYLVNGDWGLGIGDCGFGPIPNHQSTIMFIFLSFLYN